MDVPRPSAYNSSGSAAAVRSTTSAKRALFATTGQNVLGLNSTKNQKAVKVHLINLDSTVATPQSSTSKATPLVTKSKVPMKHSSLLSVTNGNNATKQCFNKTQITFAKPVRKATEATEATVTMNRRYLATLNDGPSV